MTNLAVASRRVPLRDRLPLALLLGGGAALAGLRLNDIFSLNGDNAVYLLLARNLVTGQPYNNAGFPWGYPLLLTPGAAVAGPGHLLDAIPWLKGLSVLAFLLSIGLLYAFYRTRHGPALAALTVALFAVNDVTLSFTNDLMTELPYVAASFAALLYWQRRLDRGPAADPRASTPPGWRPWLVGALLLAVPYYIRTIGLAMLAAPPLLLAWRRHWRGALALGAALALLAAPWALFSATTAPNRNYTAALWLRDPYHPELGRVADASEFLGRFGDRVNLYGTVILPALLLPPQVVPDESTRRAGGMLLGLVALAGYARRLRRRIELPEVYLPGFLVILCSWPWTGDRFLLPVLPLILHYIAEAVSATVAFAGRLVGRPGLAMPALAALALLLVPLAAQDTQTLAQNLRYRSGDRAASGLTAEDYQYLAVCDWLRDNTPPGSVILSRKSSITEVYGGRPSELIPLIPPDQYLAWLTDRRVGYVLEDAFPWSSHTIEYLRPAMQQHPTHFHLIFSTPPPVFRVWQFTP
ncbi:MAG TPA: hypothetical protein VM536_06790 [Chloroflexia bacterium]|nr:hypothetical protein [Chloroflexia bacterium]